MDPDLMQIKSQYGLSDNLDTPKLPMDQLLELKNISKHFGGVAAVSNVSLQIGTAEVVALLGNNGAGKSTVMRIISGLYQPDEGQILLSKQPIRFRNPKDAQTNGIEAVPQELALASYLSVEANIFLGRELRYGRSPLAPLNRRKMAKRSKELIESFGVHIPNMAKSVKDLSGGQQQGVAIGRAVAWGSRLVVLDEPTAALGVKETRQVEDTILKLRSSGVSVLLVSHQLDQVFRVSDRAYVMWHGQIVGQKNIKETNPEEIVSLITGVNETEVF